MGIFDTFKDIAMMPVGGAHAFDKPPDNPNSPIDPGTNGLIKSQMDSAQESPEALAARTTSGAESSRGLINPSQQLEAQKALGQSSDPTLNDAINARANRAFSGDLNRIQQRVGINAVKQHAQNLTDAQNMRMQQQNFDLNRYKTEFDKKVNADAARNQAIGSILSTVGMGVGMAFGGPAGAQAGSKAGGLAGNQQMQTGAESPSPASSYGAQADPLYGSGMETNPSIPTDMELQSYGAY